MKIRHGKDCEWEYQPPYFQDAGNLGVGYFSTKPFQMYDFALTHYSLANIESSFSMFVWHSLMINGSLWLCRNVGSLSTTRHVISIGIRSILDSVDVVPGLGKVYDDVSIIESITDTTKETDVGETPEDGPGMIDD